MDWLFIFLLFIQILRVAAVATNQTIDDQNGDSLTGALPVYAPENVWTQGNECSTCFAQPNYQEAFDHTWHDATLHPTDPADELNVTMVFSGTAIYAYCILDNYITYTTFTNLTFSIDGVQVGDFSYNPDGSNTYLYDVLVYANTSIPNGNHTFGLHVPQGANASFVLFDYVQYTYDPVLPTASKATPPVSNPTSPSSTQSPSRSSTNTVTITSITVGVVAGLLLVVGVIAFLCWRRRDRRNKFHHRRGSLLIDESPVVPSRGLPSNSDITSWPPSLSAPVSTITPYTDISQSTISSRDELSNASSPAATENAAPLGAKARRQISRRLQDRKQRLVLLEHRRSSLYPPSATDTVENQVEDLRQEVARLHQILADGGGEAPPQYQD